MIYYNYFRIYMSYKPTLILYWFLIQQIYFFTHQMNVDVVKYKKKHTATTVMWIVEKVNSVSHFQHSASSECVG